MQWGDSTARGVHKRPNVIFSMVSNSPLWKRFAMDRTACKRDLQARASLSSRHEHAGSRRAPRGHSPARVQEKGADNARCAGSRARRHFTLGSRASLRSWSAAALKRWSAWKPVLEDIGPKVTRGRRRTTACAVVDEIRPHQPEPCRTDVWLFPKACY